MIDDDFYWYEKHPNTIVGRRGYHEFTLNTFDMERITVKIQLARDGKDLTAKELYRLCVKNLIEHQEKQLK